MGAGFLVPPGRGLSTLPRSASRYLAWALELTATGLLPHREMRRKKDTLLGTTELWCLPLGHETLGPAPWTTGITVTRKGLPHSQAQVEL